MTPNMIDQNGTLKGMVIIPILTQKISNVDFKHSIVKREVCMALRPSTPASLVYSSSVV
jgi:hypothetical protein